MLIRRRDVWFADLKAKIGNIARRSSKRLFFLHYNVFFIYKYMDLNTKQVGNITEVESMLSFLKLGYNVL